LGTKHTLRGSHEAALFDHRHKHFKLHEFHIEFSPFFSISTKRTRPLSISDNGLWHWIDFFCAGRLSGFGVYANSSNLDSDDNEDSI